MTDTPYSPEFKHTMELIREEAETLHRLTRVIRPEDDDWCLLVAESIHRLAEYMYIQDSPPEEGLQLPT